MRRVARTMTACAVGTAMLSAAFAVLSAQTAAPAPVGSVGPRPNVGPSNRPIVVPAAVERGARVWSAECVTCHGASARGSETVPSLLRSLLILRDRQGSELGPFLKKGHPTQSGRPSASLTDAETADVMQFIRQRINDTLRGSPVFEPGNILTGNAAAGAAYLAGVGQCTTCHSVTGDLAGIATRYPNPVDLQQRMLFPPPTRFGARGGAPSRTAVTVAVTPVTGSALSGVLVDDDDFYVSVRDGAGVVRTVKKVPGLKVVVTDPLKAHHEWLDRVTDKDIHDLVAYLVTLK